VHKSAANKEELGDALSGRLTEAQRIVLELYLQQIGHIERQITDLEQVLAAALAQHLNAIERLCEIPGISVRTAQQIIAEIGPRADAFASAGKWHPGWLSVQVNRKVREAA